MSTTTAPKAIVIGSGVVSLGVINDLAADNVTVAHISPKSTDLALRSRWPKARFVMAAEEGQTDQLLTLLQALPPEWNGACLLPTTDLLVRIISKNLDILAKRFVTPVNAWDTLLPIINKGQLYEIAAGAGIPTPMIIYGNHLADTDAWIEEIQYPVIVKPSETPAFFSRFNVKALQADNRKELEEYLGLVSQYKLDVMVSEIIPGDQNALKSYRAYVSQNGEFIAEMCSEKIRSHPPDYGVGIVQRTVPINDTIRQQGQTLLQALNFSGFASVEFKFDLRDKQFKLIEINPRPAMIQRMFRKAGINFAKITVDDLTGCNLESEYTYRNNVYGIHNAADLYHVKSHLKRGLSGLMDFVKPYFSRRKVFLLPPIRDPMPYLHAVKKMIVDHYQEKSSPGTQTQGNQSG